MYKLVFHLEKAESAENLLREKNVKENVGSKLMHESGDEFDDEDDNDEVDFVSRRAVELVDRNSGKSPHVRTKMVVDYSDEEKNDDNDDNNDNDDDDGENGYVMPSLKLV